MVVTGSQRQGNLSSPSVNPSEPALKLYLFAGITSTLSISSRQCWPQLPQFSSLRWALLLAVVSQEIPRGSLGAFGFASYPAAA